MSHFVDWPWPRVSARGVGRWRPKHDGGAARRPLSMVSRGRSSDGAAGRCAGIDQTRRWAVGGRRRRGRGTRQTICRGSSPVPGIRRPLRRAGAAAGAGLDFCRGTLDLGNVEIKPSPGHEARTGALVAPAVAPSLCRSGAARLDDAGYRPAPPACCPRSPRRRSSPPRAEPDLPCALLVDVVPDDWRERLDAGRGRPEHGSPVFARRR